MPDPAKRFEIADGNVVRADAGQSTSWRQTVRSIPGVGRLLALNVVGHFAAAVAFAELVRERPRFVLNEMRNAPGSRRYTLRARGLPVVLRHRSADKWTLQEIFGLELYAPPASVDAVMRGREAPTILDLGANVGLFGLDALDRYPGARVIAYEPDPGNALVHHELIERRGAPAASWRLIEACAGPRETQVQFLPLNETGGHVVSERSAGTLTVPMHDVLAEFASADLVKLDIEGGEWALLADERFFTPPVIVIEYHPEGCTERDPGAVVRRVFAEHGYTLEPLFEHPLGVGMLWAYRAGELDGLPEGGSTPQ